MIFNIIKSIIAVAIISAIISGIMFSIGLNFIKCFTMLFCGQILISFVGYQLIEPFILLRNKKLENDRIAEFSKQGVEAECANCNTKSIVPVKFNSNNDFICENCSRSNSIYINITTAQKTEPLSIDPLSVNTFIGARDNE
jgi:hypothetical protein